MDTHQKDEEDDFINKEVQEFGILGLPGCVLHGGRGGGEGGGGGGVAYCFLYHKYGGRYSSAAMRTKNGAISRGMYRLLWISWVLITMYYPPY